MVCLELLGTVHLENLFEVLVSVVLFVALAIEHQLYVVNLVFFVLEVMASNLELLRLPDLLMELVSLLFLVLDVLELKTMVLHFIIQVYLESLFSAHVLFAHVVLDALRLSQNIALHFRAS